MKVSRFRGKPLTGANAPRWVLGPVLRATVGRFVAMIYRTRFLGLDNVPLGGAILAGNHVSYLDPVLLWTGSPRPAHFVAKVELWDNRLLGWLLDRVWVIPVRRGTADREMITTATGLLGRGELIGMFPEGTRSHSADPAVLGEAHDGVSFIALRAGVPIVPIRISGTDKAWGRGRKLPRLSCVTVRFLEPVRPEQFEGSRKQRMEAMTAEVMRRIAQAATVTEESA